MTQRSIGRKVIVDFFHEDFDTLGIRALSAGRMIDVRCGEMLERIKLPHQLAV